MLPFLSTVLGHFTSPSPIVLVGIAACKAKAKSKEQRFVSELGMTIGAIWDI